MILPWIFDCFSHDFWWLFSFYFDYFFRLGPGKVRNFEFRNSENRWFHEHPGFFLCRMVVSRGRGFIVETISWPCVLFMFCCWICLKARCHITCLLLFNQCLMQFKSFLQFMFNVMFNAFDFWFFQIRFDECMVFQKLSPNEKVLLSVMDYLNKN